MLFIVAFLLVMYELATISIKFQGCVMCWASWVTQRGGAEWRCLSQGWPWAPVALLGRARCGVPALSLGGCRPAQAGNCCRGTERGWAQGSSAWAFVSIVSRCGQGTLPSAVAVPSLLSASPWFLWLSQRVCARASKGEPRGGDRKCRRTEVRLSSSVL